MKGYFGLIDTQTSGPRCDVTPLFANSTAFAQLITDLSQPFISVPITHVAGIDALGFILGGAVALHLHKGFVPLRKAGKLPGAVTAVEFVDYSGHKKGLELRQGILQTRDQVLVVDEWIETGAQVQAAIDLIEQAGAVVAGIATINIDNNPLPMHLRQEYLCHALWYDMQLPTAER